MNTKVCLIHPADLFGPKIGGAETFLKDFIKYSPPAYDISIIGVTSDAIKRKVNVWNEVCLAEKVVKFLPMFFVRNENKKSIIPLTFRFTRALTRISKKELDNSVLIFNRLEPLIALSNCKQLKIAIIHDDIEKLLDSKHSESIWSRFPILFKTLISFVIPSVDHIFTTSHNTVAVLSKSLKDINDKISYLPLWADLEIFHSTSEPKIEVRKRLSKVTKNITLNTPWILFVGRLQKVKAPDLLLKSFIQLKKKYGFKRANLIIIGNGDLKKSIEKIVCSHELNNCVYFIDVVEKKLLSDYYRASDVLVITSYFETGPLIVLESLSCGTPVVTTNVGEVKEFVKSEYSGEIVESFDPSEIANRIEIVLNSPHIYNKKNCEKSVVDYTPQNILAPLYEYIEKIR